jgi:hypothetical protein
VRVRYSHRPASGWSCISQARSPTFSSACEILLGRLAEQALVDEGLDVGQDDLAVGVVLDLGVGGVADPHRPHAAIAGQPSASARRASPRPTPRRAAGCGRLWPRRRCCADSRDNFRARRARRAGSAPGRCNKRRGSSSSDSPSCGRCPAASGIEVVSAATIAPVSSCWHSFSAIAARITTAAIRAGWRGRAPSRANRRRSGGASPPGLADIADERLVRAEEEMMVALEPEGAAVEQVADRRVGGQAKRLRLRADSGYGWCRWSARRRARPSPRPG